VLVVEHEPECPPAHLGTWLAEAGAELAVCRPWAGDEVPDRADLASYGAVLVLGGSMGAHDDATSPWLGPVKELLRAAVEADVPTLGVCLGHQLLAVALGGEVEPCASGQQVGVFDLGWVEGAVDDDLLGVVVGAASSGDRVRGLQWNSDVVTALPPGATLLAAMPGGEVQVVRFGRRAWGVQHHPEIDRAVLVSWAAGDRDDHLEKGIDSEAVLDEVEAVQPELDRVWRPLAGRLVELAQR
jgi:GMP synthase (glutamine-hydrolysing)